MKSLIYVGGVMGVGKSKLLESVINNQEGGDIIIELGQLIRKEALTQNLINNELEFYELPRDVIRNLRRTVIGRIKILIECEGYSRIIFSSHYSLPIGDKIISTFNSATSFSYNKLILVECAPEQLARRIILSERKRKISEYNKLEFYLLQEREIALSLAQKLNLPLYIVQNDDFTKACEMLKYYIYEAK